MLEEQTAQRKTYVVVCLIRWISDNEGKHMAARMWGLKATKSKLILNKLFKKFCLASIHIFTHSQADLQASKHLNVLHTLCKQ